MKRIILIMLLCAISFFELKAQNIVKGVIKENGSSYFLQNVSVRIKGTEINTKTDANGVFTLVKVPSGKQIVVIKKRGFETQNFPINLLENTIDLETILLYREESYEEQDLSTIVISDDELNDDTSGADNISGLLQASRDVYSRTAAFEWSPSFYRIRGLDSENGKVLINGIEMNKLSGRPQWSNWGGLNDVLRNQEFSNGLKASNYTFGDALGATNISTRASEYRAGGRVSYASSNRSYVHRFMASYTSGMLKKGWAFAVSGSRRMANEGFTDGTLYNAYSMFASVEKKLNDRHSLNVTSIFAFNKRGKSAPNTQEVFDIKGIQYNPYWGYQDGKIRNSRVKRVEEPILMLNHYFDISENTTINTNLAYQYGEIGNSRLDYNGTRLLSDGISIVGGGSNPDPTYYQKLPSYALRNGNTNVYDLLTSFQENGQINWDALYEQNLSGSQSTNSKYVLYEDRNDDQQFTANTILTTNINDNITLNGKLNYTQLNSKNFAEIIDLLGGKGYLNVDAYGDTYEKMQNDLQNPNQVVNTQGIFKYNYELNSNVMSAFAQGQFIYSKVDFYITGDITKTTHQRNGLYQNGSFKNNSLGKSEKLAFTNFSGKGGLTYKITGRHLLDINGGYITKAPSLRNSFSNSRENNAIVNGLESEKMIAADASYIFRSPMIQAKVTGYYIGIKDATEISFYFADGIDGEGSEFVQEILTDVEKKHFGVEIGLEVQVTPTIKVKGAANIGQYTYDNNPSIYLTSDNSDFSFPKTQTFLKNYKIASGPQKAYSIGFEYRDPSYWWFSASGNFLEGAYVNISPLKRTSNFALDTDGLPFTDYDPIVARELLAQEKFDNYFTLNAVGGKSWKVGDKKHIGFFASISNILNKHYKTGGFEQARTANYRKLKEDFDLKQPVFGNKYWYGRGVTYFLNVYYKF